MTSSTDWEGPLNMDNDRSRRLSYTLRGGFLLIAFLMLG